MKAANAAFFDGAGAFVRRQGFPPPQTHGTGALICSKTRACRLPSRGWDEKQNKPPPPASGSEHSRSPAGQRARPPDTNE